MLAVKVAMDLRRELSKVNEAMTFESSVAENWRNEELESQMGCSREDPNEVSSEKDNPILPLEEKKRKLKKLRLRSRKRKRRRCNHSRGVLLKINLNEREKKIRKKRKLR